MNLLRYNETTWEGNPVSLLTDNLNNWSIKIVAIQKISEVLKKCKLKHGMCGTPIYKAWVSMLQRCENPKSSVYKWYGGRNISVCERWHDFRNFFADMGERPEGLTLDRWPDKDGNYEPGNCRWATWEEQANNRRLKSCGPCKPRWFCAINKKIGIECRYYNQQAFAREWGLDVRNISICLRGIRKTCKGWKFKYF